MNWPRLLLSFAVAAGLTTTSACSSSNGGAGASARNRTSPAYEVDLRSSSLPPPSPEVIDKIRVATTPSDAVAQYSSAIASGVDPLPLERAYVRRMVAFGLPEMAEAQAADLVRRAPDDGVARAVAAFMSARRGQNDDGLKEIAVAARNAPDDTFVQRTAGQMLAWYDSQPDHTSVSAEAQQAAFEVRERLHEQQAFADAYRDAWDDQHQDDQAFGPTTQPSTNPALVDAQAAAQPPATEPGYYDSGLPPVPPMYYPPYYTDPYTYRGYGPYYEPYWPSAYYGFGLGYGYGLHRSLYPYPYYGYRLPYYRAPLSHRSFDHRFDHDHFDHHGDDGNRIHDYRRLGDDPRARSRTQDRVTPSNPRPARPQAQQPQARQQQPQQRQPQRQQQQSSRRAPAQSSRSHDNGDGRSGGGTLGRR